VVDYNTEEKEGCTTPPCQSVCAVADITGKLEGFTKVKECFT